VVPEPDPDPEPPELPVLAIAAVGMASRPNITAASAAMRLMAILPLMRCFLCKPPGGHETQRNRRMSDRGMTYVRISCHMKLR